jgi:hypothetical protein
MKRIAAIAATVKGKMTGRQIFFRDSSVEKQEITRK